MTPLWFSKKIRMATEMLEDNGLTLFFISCYIIGVFCACSALLKARTPQGAMAWVISLLLFPFISVPFFLVFGQTKFEGYNVRRRLMDQKVQKLFYELDPISSSFTASSEEMRLITSTLSNSSQPGFTVKNQVSLLIDGKETYASMQREIENAKNYIIFQSYIFREDEIGEKFIELLIKKAQSDIRVTFIHDNIGNNISSGLLKRLKEAGVRVGPFNDKILKHKIQINFRNHRKILIIDGRVGFIGGLNIGDDYLGKWPKWGDWRDTHMRIEGPAVIAAQLASAKDWYFSKEVPMDVDWKIHESEGDAAVMILPTGPADERHTCLLAHIALINSANERLWIANPYFVPPESLVDALILASLRGVDVKVLIPAYSDAHLIQLASEVYQERLIDHGIKIFKYNKGFLHQKVMLVDDKFSTIGSVNFDCRSMFINFEVTSIVSDRKFTQQVTEMLQKDFSSAIQIVNRKRNVLKAISSRSANLFAPML